MASGMTARKEEKPIPEILTDPSTGKRYLTGKFLGKGGFARCYELTDAETKIMYAGKIVAKSLLIKKHQKDKMAQEINIHRALGHAHVVQFHTFFEDNDYIYILLELCKRRSMMELHKRRRAITEPETRYYVKQIVCACQYLHNTKVIHRDLKLGNLFLNDDMEIKIGDFGLATRIDFEGERKRTLCGTPNYIAPEVLGKKGHSFEVDSWSLGCIIYTLLVGKPPFETTSLKDTYTRIKKNEYHIPSRLSAPARNLITRLLKSDPSERPNMDQIAMHEFFSSGYLPNRLPTSCLSMAPRFDAVNKIESLMRKPLIEINTETAGTRPVTADLKKDSDKALLGKVQGIGDGLGRPATAPVTDQWKGAADDPPSDYWLSDLYTQLTNLVASKPSDKADVREDDAEEPAAIPIYWVSKWVDYSDKYGLGYQLCDNSVGVLFNDTTRLLLLANGENIQYIERGGAEHYHTLKAFPDNLTKKVTLLKYFRNYMTEHLLKAGANMTPREQDEISRLPCLQSWFRTRSGMVLHLSNGSVQINFFQDHTKIICCPLMSAVSYIDEKKNFRVFRFSLIEKHGCSKELACRLRYARTMVERLMNSKSASGKHKASS